MEDVEAAFRIYSDPEVMRFLGRNGAGATVATIREMEERLQTSIDKYNGDLHGYVYAALILKENGAVVGTTLLKPLELSGGQMSADEIEIGWHLSRQYWGLGLGTESAFGVMQYGFVQLPINELNAIAYLENFASIRIMRKIGMVYVGSTHRYYGVTAEHYQITRETWETQQSDLGHQK